ncbi:Hsp33 family molecular chaperone HslO [Clostridiales bacterium COT073_COT-073]|nr:Hsp33 family molecular chaperone HslO [Clostridiales bacterium COT073_COT-073]
MSIVELYTDQKKELRLYITNAREIVETARNLHHSLPLATAALGRLLIGTGLMYCMEKSERVKLTVQIKGDGPLGGLLATVEAGDLKGYTINPDTETLIKENGKLDISGGIGHGRLSVVKDFGLKEPYSSQMNLVSGEIAEDFTAYFAESEQTPSAVALGVLVDVDGSVRQAGGFIVQLMPFASEETISQLEKNIATLPTVTQLLEQGMSTAEMADLILQGLSAEKMEEKMIRYHCNCEKERFIRAVRGLQKEELADILAENKPITVECHFCDKKYEISIDELKNNG